MPTLRNVTLTAPYFHDGSVADLGQAIRIMARLQIGRELDEVSVREINAFLGALASEAPAPFSPPPSAGRRP